MNKRTFSLVIMIIMFLAACKPTGVTSGLTAQPENSLAGSNDTATAPDNTRDEASITYLSTLYYEKELFNACTAWVRPYNAEGVLKAGFIPHHLMASDMIVNFFSLAAAQQQAYDSVILLSTMHFPDMCENEIVTALAGWNTPFAKVEPDVEIIHSLLSSATLKVENNLMAVEYDHGVAGLVPFVGYFLPKAKVTTILVSNRISAKNLDLLSQHINELCQNEKTLFVSSVDCSHYLMPDVAEKRDIETETAIQNFDYNTIASFGDSNIDSPQATALFLKLADKYKYSLIQLDHSSSHEKNPVHSNSPKLFEGITTYFVFAAFANTN